MNSKALENTASLSAAARYNTERRSLLEHAYDHHLRLGTLFREDISKDDIRDFAAEEGSMEIDDPENNFDHLLLTYADDPNRQHYQMYLGVRYSPASVSIRQHLDFSAVDLVSMEAMIYNLVTERADHLGIESDFHVFEDKQEFVQLDDFEEPSELFQSRWWSCIQFSRSELIDEFLARTAGQPAIEERSLSEVIDSANSMLSFLTKPLNEDENYGKFQYFRTPIFETPGSDSSLIVPFPNLLVTTAQIRIERLFQENEGLRTAEDDRKGDLVEDLVLDAFGVFENRNLLRSFHFKDPHPREADGLLFFENSFWAIEVKSHPIFRKLPSNIETALHRYEEKVKTAINQGTKALDFLRGDGRNLFSHLTDSDSPEEMDRGVIVLLDGLLPTLFSQNRRADETFGISSLYENVSEEDRVYILTLFDLYELTNQVEELDCLEDFLLWRTDYGFKMPVHAFNEREYWAMYFDNYSQDEGFRKAIDGAAEKDMLVPYISQRFNDKPYLPEDGFQELE